MKRLYILIKKKKFFCWLILSLFLSSCTFTSPEKTQTLTISEHAAVFEHEIQIFSTTQTEKKITKKKGWGIICGKNFGYFPVHLWGEKIEYFSPRTQEKMKGIEIEKISKESDLVEFSFENNGEVLTENARQSVKIPDIFILRKAQDKNSEITMSEIEIDGKQLKGNFFSLPQKNHSFHQGDSGRGIFLENGECVGMLIAIKNGDAIFVDVSASVKNKKSLE